MTEKGLLEEFTAKDFEELDITDDFLFYSTLIRDMELCRELLEIILNQKIRKVKLVQAQRTIKHSYDGKGVRLDVYAADDKQTVYDIEMQATSNPNLPKRSRYYQGMIDLNLIKKGEDYKTLRKSYIIFICTFDPFGKNLYRYEFENRCVDALELRLEDESTKIFLNPHGKGQKISKKLKDFLNYLVTRKCNSDFTRRLDKGVRAVVENEEWRLEYMTLRMRDRENIEKGLTAGRQEGLIAGRKEGLIAGRKEGLVAGRQEGLTAGRKEGLTAGRKEGLTAGRQEGLIAGRTESIIELLEDIGEISEKLKETIYAEQNVDRLKEWLHLAKKADTIEEFQKKM